MWKVIERICKGLFDTFWSVMGQMELEALFGDEKRWIEI